MYLLLCVLCYKYIIDNKLDININTK